MYKISPSLLDSFINARVGKYRSTYNDFVKYLKGDFVQTEAQLKGIRFEELVYSAGFDPSFSIDENRIILEINKNLGNGEKQVYLSKIINIDSEEIQLKGYTDWVSDNAVHDIKYSNAKVKPKYHDSMQWRFYLYMSGKSCMYYELCHNGEYTRHKFRNHSGIEFEIQYYCRMMIEWLKENDLINLITIDSQSDKV